MLSVITGENSFAAQTALKQAISVFVAQYTDMGLEQLDGEQVTIERIQEAIESMPFLAARKLVVLKNPSSNKQFIERAASLLANLDETTDVIVYEAKLDKRTAYYKFLKSQPGFTDFTPLEQGSLRSWVVERAKSNKASISASDANYLIDRIGSDQHALDNEIAKLALYDSAISRETIDLLTEKTPQSTTFDLLDAALGGNAHKALALYSEQRMLKVEPQQILALLGWQLHVMAVVSAAGGKDAASIAKDAKLNPYVVRKTQGLVTRMPAGKLWQLIVETAQLDLRLKTERIDPDQALQNLILTMK